ncbi:hypothetical protein PO883_33950, partial [Massilia sp. DJPM01]|uniref:hypothetical protein n=1 Tax=Massilia sp. DJPM01 TaxID=3024404 RepID=UPI00259D4AE9
LLRCARIARDDAARQGIACHLALDDGLGARANRNVRCAAAALLLGVGRDRAGAAGSTGCLRADFGAASGTVGVDRSLTANGDTLGCPFWTTPFALTATTLGDLEKPTQPWHHSGSTLLT